MVALERCMDVRDGHLCMDGLDVVALAEQAETPFFLFSEAQLRWNIEGLRNAFARRHLNSEIFYASKACSNLWVLDQVRRSGINVEVNSGGELAKALRVGFAPEQIVFNGAAKTRAELGAAIDAGIRAILVDSTFELERIADVARDYVTPANVALRVDVDVPTVTHPGIATTHGGKAGIDLDDARDAFGFAAAHEWLALKGMHMHIGSQITGTDPYVSAVETALDLIEQVEAAYEVRLEFLDAGGGMAIPHRGRSECQARDYFCASLTPDDYAGAICDVLARRRPDLRLFVEPGRAIVGSAGILVTRIENQKVKGVRDEVGKRIADEHWVTVDGGFNAMLEHVLYRWYYRCIVASRAADAHDTPFRVAGPLCDGGDVFVGDEDSTLFRLLPAKTTANDVVVFLDAGAYSMEMMSSYNARPRAAAFAVKNGRAVSVRTRESFEEMMANDAVGPPLAGGHAAASPKSASRRKRH